MKNRLGIRVRCKFILLSVFLLLTSLMVVGHSEAQTYSIKFAWDKAEFDIGPELSAGYKIYYKEGYFDGPPYEGTAITAGNSPIRVPIEDLINPDLPEYTVTGVSRDTVIYFTVSAYVRTLNNYDYESEYSNEVVFNDDDRDRMADDWEAANGLNPANANDAYFDSDNDGYPNITEYSARTDPQNQNNFPSALFGTNHITVTDVTPSEFSVIWQATEPSSCDLVVYDASGVPLNNVETVYESALHLPAEENGVMKARVTGLQASTTYGFQTVTVSKQSGVIVVSPYPELVELTTESSELVVVNDSIKQKIYDKDGNPAEGTLLVASVTGSNNPITAWVGGNVASPWAVSTLR